MRNVEYFIRKFSSACFTQLMLLTLYFAITLPRYIYYFKLLKLKKIDVNLDFKQTFLIIAK